MKSAYTNLGQPVEQGEVRNRTTSEQRKRVKKFRQILLWPLQLMPLREGVQIHRHWEYLSQEGKDNPWYEVADEFTGDPFEFKERHYAEFVTFLPHVQRFLYGEGVGVSGKAGYGESPIHVFRRCDVAGVRATYADSDEPTDFHIAHVDLYFLYDLDIVIPVVEIFAQDLSLERAQDTLFRFGRAYPPYWEENGQGGHCLKRVEWLSPTGAVLAASDYEKREKYLSFACRHRSPCIASHWEFLLKPMVLHHSGERGLIRYRQLEYYRMPVMNYLALEDPQELTRGDYVRLALASAPGDSLTLPYSSRHLQDFEHRYCYDRYWESASNDAMRTRFMCCGYAFTVVGSADDPFYTNLEVGLLGQFRHQYFLLFLIGHFQKAALLMLSDRLVVAITRLNINSVESIKEFKRSIRQILEIFLRFTHRYWFHELSNQVPAHDMFCMLTRHLDTDQLYVEVRDEIQDMSRYLDSDGLRRQAETVVRLTVVTTFGLVGTVVTGFLGMNLIAAADNPLPIKALYFAIVFIPVFLLTLYTIIKSKRLSEFLDALSDERLPGKDKLNALMRVWRKKRRGSA
jgi:hypothetical protein